MRLSTLLLCICAVAAAAMLSVHPASAATIDTTGGTTILNVDAPGNDYTGNGTLQVSDDGFVSTVVDINTTDASYTPTNALSAGVYSGNANT